jgi:catechol-2,3-dioxygenase
MTNTVATATPTLHHVNLKTTRMAEMIEWYGKVVGMRLVHLADVGAWLSNDAANHRLALLAVPGLSDDPDKICRTGLHHIAYEYGSMDELLDNYLRLKSVGIEPHACLDHGMTMSFYYVDPDGNSVELQCDEFGDWAQSTRYIETSPTFAENPIGVNLDPGLVVAARDAGAPSAQIHERAMAGEFASGSPLDLRLPAP